LFKTLGIVGQIAGIEQKVGPQVLRRTMNTLLVEAGVSAVVVRAQMGHTTPRMTDRYAGIHQSVKVAAVDALVAATKEVLSP
jgi:integrase